MKRIFTLLVVVLLLVGSVFSENAAAVATTKGLDAIAFHDEAAAYMRQYFEDLGYVETQYVKSQDELLSQAKISDELYRTAKSDLKSASPEEKEQILAARREVVYHSGGWYADDGRIYVVRVNETTREWSELPKFSEFIP